MQAAIAYDNGDFLRAVEQVEKSMPTWYRVGNVSGLLFGFLYLVLAWEKLGDLQRVETTLSSAEAAAAAMPQKWGTALLVIARARLLAAGGDSDEAVRRGERAAEMLRSLGDLRGLAEAHELLAQLLWRSDPGRAREELKAADGLRRRIGAPLPPSERAAVEDIRRVLSL
jgi:hypothetical protein